MKKLLIIATLFIILVAGEKKENNFSLRDYFSGEYYAYVDKNVDNSVFLGFCYMTADNIETNEIIGESMKIYDFEVSSAIDDLDAYIIKSEWVEDAVVIYAYTNKIETSVNAFDATVNLQIACYDEYCIIGWPLILGSF